MLHINWVPRELNQEADDVSKLIDSSDWRLQPGLFEFLDSRWGPHSIDLFASSKNTHCARFFSRFGCPGTLGVDAFSHDWSLENNWINPPFSLIGRVWLRLQSSLASASMIVPFWPSAPWWNLVTVDGVHLASSIVDWMWLPRWDTLFTPGHPQAQTSSGVSSPRWQVLAIRVVFGPRGAPSSMASRCTRGGCPSCRGRQ